MLIGKRGLGAWLTPYAEIPLLVETIEGNLEVFDIPPHIRRGRVIEGVVLDECILVLPLEHLINEYCWYVRTCYALVPA